MNTDHFAVDVTYKRDNVSYPLVAIVSQSPVDVMTGFTTTTAETRDYLIETSQMQSLMPPVRGEKIVDGGRTYVVTAPSGGREWVYADEDQYIVQIHTVLQKSA